jgi:hypothetical protein
MVHDWYSLMSIMNRYPTGRRQQSSDREIYFGTPAAFAAATSLPFMDPAAISYAKGKSARDRNHEIARMATGGILESATVKEYRANLLKDYPDLNMFQNGLAYEISSFTRETHIKLDGTNISAVQYYYYPDGIGAQSPPLESDYTLNAAATEEEIETHAKINSLESLFTSLRNTISKNTLISGKKTGQLMSKRVNMAALIFLRVSVITLSIPVDNVVATGC